MVARLRWAGAHKNWDVIFHHSRQKPPLHGFFTKMALGAYLPDVIIYSQFYINQWWVTGFWFCEGSNFAISRRKAWSPLTRCLHYRAARDREWEGMGMSRPTWENNGNGKNVWLAWEWGWEWDWNLWEWEGMRKAESHFRTPLVMARKQLSPDRPNWHA